MSTKKILQVLGIPYSALISIIFGMMILSFPIGAYTMFNSDIGSEINFDYPLNEFYSFPDKIGFDIPINLEFGDAFIVIWLIFLILFSISMLGPKRNFLRTLAPIISEGKYLSQTNYLVITIKWFSILILISGIINLVQESFGISIDAPPTENELIRFFEVSVAPFVEEIGFRVLLIGIPLFFIYSHRTSFKHFFKSLWSPSDNLNIYSSKKVISLIVIVAIFFGLAHILSGDPWSIGKFSQATLSGIILGWVYFRSGLVPAILIHWATNYFIFSYVYLIADINMMSISEAFSHSLFMTLEILFIILGLITLTIMVFQKYYFRKEEKLEI